MRPDRAADHSPSSSAAVMGQKSYTSTHPLGLTGPVKGSIYLTFTCTKIRIIYLGKKRRLCVPVRGPWGLRNHYFNSEPG